MRNGDMGLLLPQFLPLAAAAIALTLVGLIVIFLSSEQGNSGKSTNTDKNVNNEEVRGLLLSPNCAI